MWGERTGRPLDPIPRDAGDGYDARAHEVVAADLGDHVGAVREEVEPQWEDMQGPRMARIEREDPGVAVTRSGQGCDAHQLDRQLVGCKCVGTPGRTLDGHLKSCRGQVMEEVRVVLPEMLRKQPHVGGGGALDASCRLGAADSEQHGRCRNEEASHRRRRSFERVSSAHPSAARVLA